MHEAYSELERIADVFVEQLQKFGIDAKKSKLTGGTWGDNNALGQYETQSGWQSCGSILEPYNTLRTLIGTDGVAKTGERPVRPPEHLPLQQRQVQRDRRQNRPPAPRRSATG